MLSHEAQTKKAWAEELTSYEDIPAAFLPFLDRLPIKSDSLPPMILTPTFEGFLRRRLAQNLVTQIGSSIYVIEQKSSGLEIIEHKIEDINCVEEATFLLRSWLKIYSTGTTAFFEFSSVSMRLFRPMIEAMRRASPEPTGGPNPERDKFNYLLHQDYKFMNYARKSILPDEIVRASIMQQEILKPLIKGWGIELTQTIVPKHICILTNKELILIRETIKPWWHVGSNYGGIWQYIPLSRISSLEIKDQDDEMTALSVNLPGDLVIEAVFSATYGKELQHLIAEFESMAA